MIRVFISQGMKGKPEDEILSERSYLADEARSCLGSDIEVIQSYFKEWAADNTVKRSSIGYLGESIKLMANADFAVFPKDWRKYRGCRIEHAVATEYGISIEVF